VSNKTLKTDSKIYNVPDGGILRRTRRPDGISFLTRVSQEQNEDPCQASVEVELRLTKHHGAFALTMRRVCRRPDSWFCNTSTICLPSQAAAELAQAITALNGRHL
jgi:hypothetical protein